MRYVRPFDLAAASRGEAQPWLIAPEEGFGCSARLVCGDGAPVAPTTSVEERFGLVLDGEAALFRPEGQARVGKGSLMFIPAGAAGAMGGDACWLEISGTISAANGSAGGSAQVIEADPSRLLGEGFQHQSLADRESGARSMRVNMLQVQPGAGSPDYHIHVFDQFYVILDGEMTVDVGQTRYKAPSSSLVCLPRGVVHRNFNGAGALERHISLLVPEPMPGEIFDFAVDIRDCEAELMTAPPL